MADAENLANYVAGITPELVEEEKARGRNRLVPPQPKPGEVIVCQQCGRPMYPEDFSKDPQIRRHEFKWHMHWACEQQIWDQVDRETPGLLSERKNGINIGRAASMFAPVRPNGS